MESREETYQPLHVVNFKQGDDKHVVRAIKQQRAENYSMFLPPQVLYCNSYSSGCQGLLKIKNSTQKLIRSKQRKSSLRPFPSSSHKALAHTWWKWSHLVLRVSIRLYKPKNWYAVNKEKAFWRCLLLGCDFIINANGQCCETYICAFVKNSTFV